MNQPQGPQRRLRRKGPTVDCPLGQVFTEKLQGQGNGGPGFSRVVIQVAKQALVTAVQFGSQDQQNDLLLKAV